VALLAFFAAAIFGIIVLQQLWAAKEALQVIPYSEFLNNLKGGKIA
jgi:hypothetical protein